jgi:hypothetical protein
MEPQSLGMSDQPSYRTLHQLRDLFASGRTAPSTPCYCLARPIVVTIFWPPLSL